MVTTAILDLEEDLLYPSSDGNPMAENTRQYEWIVYVKENLEVELQDQQDVFIAGDLLWYPESVKKPPAPCQAPDIMVIFGRPKGHRLSYKQWEEDNIPPQVAFEILSESNRTSRGKAQMAYKLDFYDRHGVEEYYLYDPDFQTLNGYLRTNGKLQPIAQMSNWISPRLGIRFQWNPGQELVIYGKKGDRFLSTLERAQAQLEAEEAKLEAQQAQLEAQQAQLEAQQAQLEAELRTQKLEAAQQQSIARLLAMGLTLDQVTSALGVAMEAVEAIHSRQDIDEND
jgi:Uma2 family endonuclease